MTYEIFIESVESRVREIFPDAQIFIQPVTKNNGIIRRGLVIKEQDENICPTIYLETFFESYVEEGDFEGILDKILNIYAEAKQRYVPDYSKITDYNWAKDRIILKLINYEKNSLTLDNIPYVPFLDLAACFSVCVEDGLSETATCNVTNEFLKIWDITIEELLEVATLNTVKLLGSRITPLNELVDKSNFRSLLGTEFTREDIMNCSLSVLSNEKWLYGASCMLYPSGIKAMAKACQTDVLIIPSSVHELLIMPLNIYLEIDEINDMIVNVNECAVEPNEILSNHAYIYRYDEDKIVCA